MSVCCRLPMGMVKAIRITALGTPASLLVVGAFFAYFKMPRDLMFRN
jgi:hypothetical protein